LAIPAKNHTRYYIIISTDCPEKVPQAKRSGIRKPDAAKLIRSAVLSHLCKALAAVHRTVGLGLKGNTSFLAAGGAGSGEELSGATDSVLASVTAGLAALGLILEASLSVEFLLAGGEYELVAALFAN
jgi:hypothetical protein